MCLDVYSCGCAGVWVCGCGCACVHVHAFKGLPNAYLTSHS